MYLRFNRIGNRTLIVHTSDSGNHLCSVRFLLSIKNPLKNTRK